MVNEARVCGLRGDSDRALELAAEADHSPTLRALNDFLACAQQARGFAYITRGRHAEAYAALERLFDPADPAHHPRERLCAVMFLAEAAVHCGRIDDARKILSEMEQLAEITPSPALHVNLLYARAVLAEDHEAEDLYLAALRTDLSRWPWHRARIQHAYGSWLRRQRRVAESRDPLRSALSAFEIVGATDVGRAGPRRAASRRRTHEESGRNSGRGGPVASGAPDRPAGRSRALQPGDRRAAVPLTPNGRLPPLPDLPQARHHVASPARPRDWTAI